MESKSSFFISMLFSVLFLVSACDVKSSQRKRTTEIVESTVVFQRELHDFGIVSGGEEVGTVFGFVNEGDAPIVIQKVEAGCGCTAVNYTKKPISPSEKGFVEVIFDSRGQQGYQRKGIRVFANIPEGSILLTITALVE